MVEVQGSVKPGFELVEEAFADSFVTNPTPVGLPELGAAVSLVVGGETVIDLWAGERTDGSPFTGRTLTPVLSCTKGMVAIVFHQLAERGLIDVNAPVTTYWPEYGQAGKENVLVRHLLTHTAGQPGLSTDLGPGGVWDWDTVVAGFAAAPTQWEPGTANGYHTLSFGHLVGEVIKRASGETVADLIGQLAEEFVVEFRLGITSRGVLARCDGLTEPPDSSPAALGAKLACSTDMATVSSYNNLAIAQPAGLRSPEWKAAGFPGGGGFSNARAMATIYGALATGRILRPDYVREVSAERVRGMDRTLGNEQAFALGWQRSLPDRANRPDSGFGHSGAWGSLGWCDLDRQVGFGYTMNRAYAFTGDERAAHLWRLAMRCVDATG